MCGSEVFLAVRSHAQLRSLYSNFTEAFKMKRSTKAAAFSFAIPGAGLWYLREPRHAIVNLAVAAVLTAIVSATGHEHLLWGLLAIAAGSSGYAHAAARALEQQPRVVRSGGSKQSTNASC